MKNNIKQKSMASNWQTSWVGKKADSDRYKPRFVKSQNPEVINFIEKIYMNIDDGRKFGEITSRRLADFLKEKRGTKSGNS